MKYILDHDGKPYNKFFEDISAIPRVSFNEEGISEYLVNFAKERDLWWYRDEIWNVIIKKPASPGYEDHPPVMLQGHTDMVGEKAPGSDFNFDTDPLELYVENGYLKAKDTTLGADCGHGVAYMLAILDDNSLKHPPIEAFFSVQEEAGIGGPKYVDYSHFTAKKLINTDVMMEGSTYLSTGSVIGGTLKKKLKFSQNNNPVARLKIAGLYGGHAAVNIHRDQANAIHLTGRILFNILKDFNINITSISGGTIKNNIPEECVVKFSYEQTAFDSISKIVTTSAKEIGEEYSESDPNLTVSIKDGMDKEFNAIDYEDTKDVIKLLYTMPTGAHRRSIGGEIHTIGSRNMGNIELDEETLNIGYMFRSNIQSLLTDLQDQALPIAAGYGFYYDEEYRYPGYTTAKDSFLNKLFAEVYRESTGKELKYFHIHAGTDVGTIVAKMSGMDVLAIGPNTIDCHRPGEALELESFARTYKYLTTIISKL